jgi:hypothetical protein
MRFVRLLGALVTFYGLSYLMYGLMQLFNRVGYHADWSLVVLNLNIGLVMFLIGVGLVRAKEWARIATLFAVTLLLSMHVFFLAITHLAGVDPTLQIMNVVLTALLFLISWSKLVKADVKELFH